MVCELRMESQSVHLQLTKTAPIQNSSMDMAGLLFDRVFACVTSKVDFFISEALFNPLNASIGESPEGFRASRPVRRCLSSESNRLPVSLKNFDPAGLPHLPTFSVHRTHGLLATCGRNRLAFTVVIHHSGPKHSNVVSRVISRGEEPQSASKSIRTPRRTALG